MPYKAKKKDQRQHPAAERLKGAGTNGARKVPTAADSDYQDMTKFHFFWKKASPFSQWHPSQYQLNGVTYSCAEQGMMHGKALLFHDTEIADQILQTINPREMKSLGRKVKFFEPQLWHLHRERIVYENSMAKFTQNPQLRKALLDTQGSLLVEASPYDSIWGIGLDEVDAKRIRVNQWPGMNLLGQILTRVREEMLNGSLLEMEDEEVGATAVHEKYKK